MAHHVRVGCRRDDELSQGTLAVVDHLVGTRFTPRQRDVIAGLDVVAGAIEPEGVLAVEDTDRLFVASVVVIRPDAFLGGQLVETTAEALAPGGLPELRALI